jgi:hypothetical protein
VYERAQKVNWTTEMRVTAETAKATSTSPGQRKASELVITRINKVNEKPARRGAATDPIISIAAGAP